LLASVPMSISQLPLSLAQRHNNQRLFADHFLNVTLPQRPDWKLLAHDAKTALDQIAPTVRAFVAAPKIAEAQVEESLVRPVLRALGHTFEVQAALRTPDGTKKPDYIFFRDDAALAASRNQTLTEELLVGRAIAVGDAKAWDRPLDHVLKGVKEDQFTNKNPAYQIAFYIQHAGVAWGILTNGRRWRLYHRDTAYKQDRFYEVDLPALVEAGDPETFLYFFAFFRREAFDPGPLGLDALLRASADYARGVGDSLKAQVYDALLHLAQGFLDAPANRLQPTPETLTQIYDASLIVLYRLLFILYAEARELLPLRASQPYREEYSLSAVAREIARRTASGTPLLPTSSRLWAKLADLFQIIDQGSPPLQVATFNGGLFDPHKHPFLAQHTVGDARLQAAIDMLARVDGQFVDYRDLAERHLGTIYEGLLEYHLEALTPPPLPAAGAGGPRFTVELFNDRGERHRTGSYYTPDFVVQYIVAQTLGPVLDAAVAGTATDAEKIAAVLRINVLDPAMGSGHFPVAAMEYIARYLVDLGVTADAGGEADLAYWKRRVAQSCIYGVDLNPLAVDLAKLSLWLATAAAGKPLSFLDHHLRCGNALVGTRVADLRGAAKPKKATRKAQPDVGQISLLDDPDFARSMGVAVGSMWLIEESAGDTINAVRQQEQIYADLRAELTRKHQTLADVAAARAFGVAVDATLWKGLGAYLTSGGFAVPQYATVLRAAQEQAAAQRFFHWDLEFPEVFFDRHGQPLGARGGFDAVIGNPPYVRQEQLAPVKPYFAQAYPETYHGMADLYVYFYQQGLRLLRDGGRMSYIVTNKWLRAGYGEPLRAFFAREGALEQIIDFGHAPIFADADVFPCIVVVRKPAGEKLDEQQVQVTAFPREALKVVQLDGYVRRFGHAIPQRRLGAAPWSLEAGDVDDLMAKIKQVGMPLAEFAGMKPFYGIKTGFNEAFLIDTPTKERLVREDPRSAEIIKPYLRGQDIKRWVPEWDGLWLIVLKSSNDFAWPWRSSVEDAELIFRQTYSSIFTHVKTFQGKLQQRSDQGRYWWELRSCSYYERFSEPKLIWKDLSFHSEFSLDRQESYTNDLCFFLPKLDLWLLAVLNSPLMWSFVWRNVLHGKDEVLRLKSIYTEVLPIAPPTDEARAEAEPAVARLVAITQANQAARRVTLDWLATEFGVATPGQKLEEFATLGEAAFIEEVRKRRAKAVGKLSPAALKALRDGYREQATPVQQRAGEALALERRLADLVNHAYGLTSEEIDLLWRTAPPRMPIGQA
jgi:hypothetical protein